MPVEPRQAGENIRCTCGATLEVPTMLKMKDLPQAEPQADTQEPSASWGSRQRVGLSGLVILLGAFLAGNYLFLNRPLPPPTMADADWIRQESQKLEPLRAWRFWHQQRAMGLDRSVPIAELVYAEDLLRYRFWMVVVTLAGVAGVALIVVAWFTPRRASAGANGREAPNA